MLLFRPDGVHPEAALATRPRDGSTRLETHFLGRTFRCLTERPLHADALLADAAHHWPGAEALVDGARRWSYAELNSQVEAVAANMQRRGLRQGDRVAIALPNSAEFVLALLGATRIGAITVPLSSRYRRAELEHALDDAAPRLVIHDLSMAPYLPELDSAQGGRQERVVVGEPGDHTTSWESLLAPAQPRPTALHEDDDWAILYTSGTTGRPKGAVQTHLGIVHGALQFVQSWQLVPGDRSVLAVPATHAAGLGVIFTMLACGGCTIVLRQFSAAGFLALAAAEKMSYAAMVPAMYSLLLRDPTFDPAKLSAWRVGGYGAAPMPPVLIEAFAQRMPTLHLVNAYGCTETTQPPVLMPLGETAEHLDSVGRLVPCADMRVVDPAGRDVAAGEPGEIWLRGPTIIPRYWNRPAADTEAFVDGWWRSGDIGSIDELGYVRVHDRIKDMIVRGGHKVFSAEVEHVLAQHGDVIESAVLAQPDAVLGERVQAVVVVRDGAAADSAALALWCSERLADYKVPERWLLQTEPLPRNANGKVLKAELRTRKASQ